MEAAGIHCVYLFEHPWRKFNSYCRLLLFFICQIYKQLLPNGHSGRFEEEIFDTITSLRNSKKQSNEGTIYCTVSKTKTTKSLNKETLREALNKLVSSKKLKVKLHNGKNSCYIENDSFHEDKSKYQEIEDGKNLFTSDHETALPQDDIETPKRRTLVINDIGSNGEIYDLHKYVQSLATEMEAMKLFIKERFCLLKKSISEINSNTDATDNSITETTHLLRKHIEFLLQENASKNTIIKILAKNQQHASNTKEVVSSEPFKTVNGNFIKNRYKLKSQNVVCSNRYDTLYPTDDSEESDSSSDAETLSSGSTSSNISNYSNRKKKKRQHKKRKINNSRAGEILTEKHNESHAIHKRKQILQQTQTHQPENQNYRQISATIEKKNTSQQKFDQIHNVKHHNRKDQEMPNRLPSTFSNAISRKKKKVVLFTDSILKTLSMGKLNSCINGANVQLKSFPGCKAMQLDHHTIPILQEQYYDAAGIHVGINDLLNSSSKKSVDEICDDIIKIALRCRSHNIATIFISSIAYSTKVNLQLIRNLNGLLYNACTKYGVHFVLFPNVTSGKMAFTCWKLEKSLLQITSLVALIIF